MNRSLSSAIWITLHQIGTLSQKDIPGHFEQQLYFYGIPGPKVDYNVIYIDEEAAIEYDCSDSFIFGYNYCVHIISRTPTLSAEKVEELVAFAGKILFPSKYYKYFLYILLSNE